MGVLGNKPGVLQGCKNVGQGESGQLAWACFRPVALPDTLRNSPCLSGVTDLYPLLPPSNVEYAYFPHLQLRHHVFAISLNHLNLSSPSLQTL